MRRDPNTRRAPARMAITDRDLLIIESVWRFRFLTREMLQQILNWSCTSKINLRLRKLYDHRYLDRRFQPVRAGQAPSVYLLGAAGATLLAERRGSDSEALTRDRYADRNYAESLLDHALGTSSFGASLQDACQSNPDLNWKGWASDRQLIAAINGKQIDRKGLLKPDGLARYECGHKKNDVFVEFDTGSESRARLKRKLEAYRDYSVAGRHTDLFKLNTFTVLIVTSKPRRAESLANYLTPPGHFPVRIGHLGEVSTAPVFGGVWMEPGRTEKVALQRVPMVRRKPK